ncbi:hypothetical protein IKF20_02740 [Candidatus Saccharibacteria bacterium]|nr:hypothetical protein [Candidatus Saccharibacteria bacterium]
MAHTNRHIKKFVSDQANNNLFLFLVLTLVAFTSVSTLILSSTFVSADESSANATVNVPEACTMTGSGMNTHTAEIPNGTYRADIGATTIKIVCNDPNGFSIYAIGFTGDEYTGTNHTKLVGTTASGNATIATGTATSGSTSNWAMKLATNSSATYPITLTNGYGSYSNVPDTYTKVAQRTSGTDTGTSATGAELTTTYAAFISSAQVADTYVGKVKYTMVHPYDAEAPEPTYDMQNLSIDKCPAASPINVVDVRDGEVYKAQRLADGKCWLLDNLRLDPTAVSLTDLQGNTNASNQTLTYFKNGGGASPYPANGVNTTWASSSDNKYDEPKVVTTYKDTTTTSYGAGSGKIGVYYNNCAASAGSRCSEGYSSTADEDICPAGWRMPTGGFSGEYAALCKAYNSGIDCAYSYNYTSMDATSTSSLQYNLSTPLSGSFYSGSAKEQDIQGSFWSSSPEAANYRHNLDVKDDGLRPSYNKPSQWGVSVRCVLK